MDTKFLIIVFVAAVVLLVGFVALRKATRSTEQGQGRAHVYELTQSLFTPAERSFFGVLETLNYEGLTITAKVRLADIFEVKKGLNRSERQRALNRVSAKHVDFLLVRKADGLPVLGIELDDSSHQRPDRKVRDEFVDAVFAATALPLVRIPVQRSYTVQEVHGALERALMKV